MTWDQQFKPLDDESYFCKSGIKHSLHQPNKQLLHSKFKVFGKSGDGQLCIRLIINSHRLVRQGHKHALFIGFNQPSHLSAVLQTMQDIFDKSD
jgi:hypothetical protein